ncbi:hypothetical protein [Shimia sp.]
MRILGLIGVVTLLAACEPTPNYNRETPPEPTSGVTISGEARTGVVYGG